MSAEQSESQSVLSTADVEVSLPDSADSLPLPHHNCHSFLCVLYSQNNVCITSLIIITCKIMPDKGIVYELL
jgi:hypothetical protein